MTRVLIVFAMLTLFTGNLFADKIVVWNLKPQAGITELEAGTVTSVLIGEVEKISKKKIIAESEVRTVIDGEQTKISCGIEDSACIAEIGASLGAPYSISGTLSKMGDYWIMTLQLIDVKKVEVESRVTKKFKGDVNFLVESIHPIVCELFKSECTEQVEEKKEVKKTPEKKKEKEPVKEKKPLRAKSVAGWTFLGAGVAMTVLGGVSHVQMNSTRDEYQKTGENEETYKKWHAVSLAGYISGGAFLAAGITFLVIDAVELKKGKQKSVSFYVYPSNYGFTAGLQGGW